MQPFVIPLGGLRAGSNSYEWHADGEFFGTFEGTEILDADLDVRADVRDDGSFEVACSIIGNVTVTCDRCLGRLVIPVSTSFVDDEIEVTDVLDLRQDVYDYTCLALPLQRVHDEGDCDPEVIKYLSK